MRNNTMMQMNSEKRRNFRSVFHQAVCLALLPAMTGCTAMLWTPACASQAVHPEIAGLVRNYPLKGDLAVVVRYRAALDGTDVDLVVPLDSAHLPKPPFAIEGQGYVIRQQGSRDSVEMAGSLDPKQLAAVLASSKTITADRAELQKHFNSADWSPAVGQHWRDDWTVYRRDVAGTACVIAFQEYTSGVIEPVPIDSAKQPAGMVLTDPGVRVLIVPTMVDRPPGDQARNKIVAVVLTPAAVVADAAGVAISVGVVGGVVAAVGVVALPVVAVYEFAHPHDVLGIKDSTHGSTTQPAPSTQPATTQVPIIPRG